MARDPQMNVTDDDVIMTAKIARAHLNEFLDYYTRLAKMEAEAEADANGTPRTGERRHHSLSRLALAAAEDLYRRGLRLGDGCAYRSDLHARASDR